VSYNRLIPIGQASEFPVKPHTKPSLSMRGPCPAIAWLLVHPHVESVVHASGTQHHYFVTVERVNVVTATLEPADTQRGARGNASIVGRSF
jgi:hypothetical protein